MDINNQTNEKTVQPENSDNDLDKDLNKDLNKDLDQQKIEEKPIQNKKTVRCDPCLHCGSHCIYLNDK